MLNTLTSNWNFFRIIRLILGLIILIQGIVILDTISILLGVVFIGLALFSAGCAGGACYTPMNRSQKNSSENIEYEEVVNQK
jgi:hypothetical protein